VPTSQHEAISSLGTAGWMRLDGSMGLSDAGDYGDLDISTSFQFMPIKGSCWTGIAGPRDR
jgi:hypothetical protein